MRLLCLGAETANHTMHMSVVAVKAGQRLQTIASAVSGI